MRALFIIINVLLFSTVAEAAEVSLVGFNNLTQFERSALTQHIQTEFPGVAVELRVLPGIAEYPTLVSVQYSLVIDGRYYNGVGAGLSQLEAATTAIERGRQELDHTDGYGYATYGGYNYSHDAEGVESE